MKDKKAGGGNPQEIELAENLFGTEVYADAAEFFAIKPGGNVSIAFSSMRFDNSSQPGALKRVVIGRLVIPVSGAYALAAGLYDFLQKQGFTPPKSETN
jgi:hypothetical protein